MAKACRTFRSHHVGFSVDKGWSERAMHRFVKSEKSNGRTSVIHVDGFTVPGEDNREP